MPQMLTWATLLGFTISSVMGSFPNLRFDKRADSWGPAVSLGPSKAEIISAVTTSYPGAMPPNQAGGLFIWPGMSNGTGDLIQSVIGSYVKGGSQCGNSAAADSEWCISSEVFGNDANGRPNQWVGSLETLLANPSDGVRFEYTLTDTKKYTWTQNVYNAATGVLMSTYTKNSGPMLGFGTAVECQSCTPTISTQTYVNTVITLKSADPTFPQTLGAGQGATHSAMTSSDGGITWRIDLITIPAMNPAGAPPAPTTTKKTTTTTQANAASTKTTTRAVTTSAKTTAAASSGGGTVAKWGQCGGQAWTGGTVCAAGSTCTYSNPWYSQCL